MLKHLESLGFQLYPQQSSQAAIVEATAAERNLP